MQRTFMFGNSHPQRSLGVLLATLLLSLAAFLALPGYASAAPNCPAVVTNTDDSGAGSLRQALADVCAGGVIDFAAALTASGPVTITLTSGELTIGKNMTIDGPGADMVAVSGNNASRIFNVPGGVSATIDGLTIRNGYAGEYGGGIYNAGTLTVTNSALVANHADSAGGAIRNEGASAVLTVMNSALVGNNNMSTYGSGVSTYNGRLVVINSTFQGNGYSMVQSLPSGGGGGIHAWYADVVVTNSTFSGNTALIAGAAIRTIGGSITLANTIFEKPVYVENCAFDYNSSDGGGNIADDGSCGFDPANGSLSGVDARLAPLADNGGSVPTLALLPGSPAIDLGTDRDCPAGDGRGIVRPQGNGCDSGAFESRGFTLDLRTGSPVARVGTAFAEPLTVTVGSDYGEPVGPGGWVSFTPPTIGAGLGITDAFGVATDDAGVVSSGVITANAIAGRYGVTVTVRGEGFVPTAFNGAPAVFNLANCLATITVTSAGDAGAGTLRQAVADVCPGGEINFSGSLTTGGPATITLTGGQLIVTKDLTITGPGPDWLAVSGNNATRVFNISAGVNAIIHGLTIRDGSVSGGGEIDNNGGGIYNSGTLTVTNSSIISNNVGGSNSGGGIYNYGVLTVINSTVANNHAAYAGGGIYNYNDTLTVLNSTFTGNVTSNWGGGIYSVGNEVAVSNSTFVSNTASQGGGIWMGYDDDLVVINSTFAGNSGGAIENSGTLTVTNSTFANNSGSVEICGADAGEFSVCTANATISGAGATTLLNTIVAQSSGILNCNLGALTDLGGNLADDASCNFNPANGSANGIAPRLSALGNYGGSTPTLALLFGSPAIDFGAGPGCPADDQRGVARPQGAGCDSGAFESRGFGLTIIGGSPQTTTIAGAFAQPLQAAISSAFGEPVGAGNVITFTPPGSGPGLSVTQPFTAVTDANGMATSGMVTANTIVGSYGVTATFGSPNVSITGAGGAGATAVVFNLTNARISPIVTLSAAPNPSKQGEIVAFTATVAEQQLNGLAGAIVRPQPTGDVIFAAAGVEFGRANLAASAATLTYAGLPPGSSAITAEYVGDSTFAPSRSADHQQIVLPLPLAVNDAAGAQAQPITIHVAANDRDPAGGGLTVVSVAAPAHGAAAVAPDDLSVVYTPAAGYSGVDTFTYVIQDANGSQDEAEVVVVATLAAEGQGKPQVQPTDPSGASAALFTTPSATVSVQLPAGFFTGTLTEKDILFISFTPATTPSAQTNNPPAGLQFGNLEYTLEVFLNGQLLTGQAFAVPLTVTITYDPALLNGLKPETLGLWFWDGAAWSTDGVTLISHDAANHAFTVALTHFSRYAFFAAAPTDLEPVEEPQGDFRLFLPAINH